MKRKFPISARASEFFPARLAAVYLSIFSIAFVATSALATRAHATVELDREYALETIGLLKATDNVDGLFADYVSGAYRDYFSKQSRFVVQDLSKEDTVLSQSKIPYAKLIQDNQLLAEIARKAHSQTLIRTKVSKEGDQYRFLIEWLHAPKMNPLATQTVILHEPVDGLSMGISEVQAQIETGLDQLIHKIPWVGHVTGRDENSVTVNIGANANLHKDDTLVISTLDDVKVHPLLHTIVDWKLTRTGSVAIDSVDDSIAFGHVVDEEPDRKIERYQKITQVIPASPESQFHVIDDNMNKQQVLEQPPSLGFVRASLWPGGFSRQYNNSSSTSQEGGGLFLGAKLDGQLWFTREWFSEMGFGYGFWSYSQQASSTSSPDTANGGSSVFDFKLDGGYSYLVTGDFTGPRVFAKLGYRSDSYSLPTGTSVASISFKTFFLGLGGDLPIRNQFGVDLDFGIGLINSVTDNNSADGAVTSANNVFFSLGGYYRLSNRMVVHAALEVLAQGSTYTDGATVSQKVITLTPSLVYYF